MCRAVECNATALDGPAIGDASMCKCLDTSATYTNCSSCETLRGSCVTTEGGYPAWCDATSRCLWGDEGGPWGVTCSKTAYTFGWDSGCSRARPVDAYPTCASCVAGGYGCGAYWCASSQQCLVGDFSEWCRAVCAFACACVCVCVHMCVRAAAHYKDCVPVSLHARQRGRSHL